MITKEDYEKVKLLDQNTEIYFGEIAKHTEAEAYFSELCFVEDEDEIAKCLNGNKRNDFDLMEFLYEQDILQMEEK